MNTSNPCCCGTDATFVTISPRVSYWYCRECKKEVNNEHELSQQDIDMLSGFQPGAPEFEKSLVPNRLTPEERAEDQLAVSAIKADLNIQPNVCTGPDCEVCKALNRPRFGLGFSISQEKIERDSLLEAANFITRKKTIAIAEDHIFPGDVVILVETNAGTVAKILREGDL